MRHTFDAQNGSWLMRFRVGSRATLTLACVAVLLSACASGRLATPPRADRPAGPSAGQTTSTASPSPAAQALAARNGLTIEGPGQSRVDTLATYTSRLRASPRTAPDRGGLPDNAVQASRAAGYELGSHLGERARISAFQVRELDANKFPQVLVVVEQNGTTIGAWIEVPELLGGGAHALRHGG